MFIPLRIQYTENEAVTLWVNTVGPYHNPQVMYLSTIVVD
jgi:hypothetical protein